MKNAESRGYSASFKGFRGCGSGCMVGGVGDQRGKNKNTDQ